MSSGGNLDVDGNAHIGGNLTIVGNITFSGGEAISNITAANGIFYGNAEGVGAIFAGTPGYTPVGTAVAQFTGDANDYLQINAQNIKNKQFHYSSKRHQFWQSPVVRKCRQFHPRQPATHP